MAPTKIHLQYHKFSYGARCQSEIQKMKLLEVEPQREGSRLEVPAPLPESASTAAQLPLGIGQKLINS